MMTDPIADMLTRIRNANTALHDAVEMPGSTMKAEVAGCSGRRATSPTTSSASAAVGTELVVR